MTFVEYNPNPLARIVDDCAVRAITKALDIDWETAYLLLSANGFVMGTMPSEKSVVSATLRQHGFYRHAIPNSCPDCYTAADFAEDHPRGVYVLGFGGHVATVKDGVIYDAWNSSNEIPQYVWSKERMI